VFKKACLPAGHDGGGHSHPAVSPGAPAR